MQLRVEVTKTEDHQRTFRLIATAPPPTTRQKAKAAENAAEPPTPIIADRAFSTWEELASALFAIGFPLPDLDVLRSMLTSRQSAVIGGFNLQRADWDPLGFTDDQRVSAQNSAPPPKKSPAGR